MLTSGLYEVRGKVYFLGSQTKIYVQFIELYNESGEDYCCGGNGMRHPAAGVKVKKTNARKLSRDEITKDMRAHWYRRINEACKMVWSNECRLRK